MDMGKKEGFRVEMSSKFEEFWRYNLLVTCGCFDENDNRVGFASADDEVAPVGSNLEQCPEGYPAGRVVGFDADACHHLVMFIYVIPNSIRLGAIGDEQAFNLDLRVLCGEQVVAYRKLEVNRWAGATFELRIDVE